VGSRATGTGAGTYLLTPPGWTGEVPPGTVPIAVPTRVATIAGRWACAGKDDLPAVAALQRQLDLAPLDPSGPSAPADPLGPSDLSGPGLPAPASGVPAELEFFEKMRVWMQAFPPAPAEVAYQQRFAPLGLLDERSPYGDPSPEVAKALVAGAAAGHERLEQASRSAVPAVDGWQVNPHVFDYNVDHLGVGTIGGPEWTIADRDRARLTRALAARVGLWGNHGYEATYAQTFVDSGGRPLTGAHRYQIRFDTLPPVGAFWSLTMYDLPDYYLVPNPICRYSIGDRTPGVRYDPDGSLTLLLQYEAPEEDDQPNWLPTPDGEFRPMLRMYQPGAAVLDGRYRLPPVVRVD
jgi:hypothetical protein